MPDQKPTNRERVKEIVDGIEQNIQELFQSDRYFDYLRTMSRFHNYSVNNTILIYMQRPDAIMPVAGFRKWKQYGRHVKKGEKGLTIIAPTPLKKKIEEMKRDPDTNAPVLDQNGNVIMEEKTVKIPLFKPVKVFSADQTEGEPIPSLATDLTGDVQQYEVFMEALRRTSPVPISFHPLEPDMDGLFSNDTQSITIREGMSEVQTVCAAVHEIAHSVLHNREKDRLTAAAAGNIDIEPPRTKDNNTMEVEAESVSYSVCQYYGIETGGNSMGYIAAWSKDRSLPELKASLETITKTVNILITSIDKHFAEVCKERGIDLTAQPEQTTPDTPERYVADFFAYLDELHKAGLISDPFAGIGREKVESTFLDYMKEGNFDSFRSVLRDTEDKVNMPSTAALRERLEKLSDQWDAALVCEIEPYFADSNTVDRFFIQTYRKQDDNELITHKPVFLGTRAECQRVIDGLDAGTITLRQVRQPDFEAPAALQNDVLLSFVQTGGPFPPSQEAEETLEQEDEALQDTTLDEYPMPDPFMAVEDLQAQGYQEGDLLPLSRERSAVLLEHDLTIYAVQTGGNPEMVFDRDDLMEQSEDTIFAIPREEWEESPDFQQAVADRMNHQEDRENAFLNHAGDCFAIYQLRDCDETRDLRYMPLPGQGVDKNFYELAYTAPLPAGANLDTLWEKFNTDHPADYCRPSMSVSDIVALKQDGVVSCHYVDRYAFTQVHSFLPQENHLKKEETALENDNGITNSAGDMVQSQQRDRMDELRGHYTQEDAALPDTTLDEYPLPDPEMPKAGLRAYGYEEDALIPVSHDIAQKLFERDFSLYIAGNSGYFNMVFEQEELDSSDIWLYAIPRGEWERSPDFQQAVADRMNHQEDRENAFLNHAGDCFAIYQVKDDPELRDIRFESLEWLKSKGRTVERDNYDLVYTAPLAAADSTNTALDWLWYQFNNDSPADYQHPSMSVSDIIAIKRDGVVSFHYCDSFGFQQVPDFIQPENYLKNAEIAVEDDCSMVDGIINNGQKEGPTVAELEAQVKAGKQISLMDFAGAIHREQREKPKKSVLDQLRSQPKQERKKSASKKSAGKER